MALRCTPDQSSEALQVEAVHQRELALDILSHVAHAFDFPDLNRFLNVSSDPKTISLSLISGRLVHSVLSFLSFFFGLVVFRLSYSFKI